MFLEEVINIFAITMKRMQNTISVIVRWVSFLGKISTHWWCQQYYRISVIVPTLNAINNSSFWWVPGLEFRTSGHTSPSSDLLCDLGHFTLPKISQSKKTQMTNLSYKSFQFLESVKHLINQVFQYTFYLGIQTGASKATCFAFSILCLSLSICNVGMLLPALSKALQQL